MPWFPIPFILTTKDGETKTDKYTYTEVKYRQSGSYPNYLPHSVIDSSTSSATSFYYYQPEFQEFGTATSPADLTPPKITLGDMNCNKIEYVVRPADYQHGNTGQTTMNSEYIMQYKLKMKLKPSAKNRVVKVRFYTKYYSIYMINYFHTSKYGQANTWSLTNSMYPNRIYKFTPCELSFSVEPVNNAKITQTQSIVSQDYGQQMELANSYGIWGYEEHFCVTEHTLFNEYEIDFSEEDSYAYVTFTNLLSILSAGTTGLTFYANMYPETTHNVMGCCTIELENKNDIIYGEGFSSIYVGEDNVNSGMVNNGESSPSAIYVGENLVWSK